MSTPLVAPIGMEKLNAFIGQFVTDKGASVHMGEVVTSAGFTGFRRATEPPFNIVYEARP